MDLGTGDGRFVVRSAQRDRGRLWLGIDPVATNMAKASNEARRVLNALFALGSVEALPEELMGLVGHVAITLPWGSLLRAVGAPDAALLRNIALLCRPGALLQIVYSASPRDANELARLGLRDPDPCMRLAEVAAAYREAGFELEDVRQIPPADLRELGTTWAKRLWRDPERRAWRLTATRC